MKVRKRKLIRNGQSMGNANYYDDNNNNTTPTTLLWKNKKRRNKSIKIKPWEQKPLHE